MASNIFELSVYFLKNFKEKFIDKIIELLEFELPASENKVEPIILEILFRL